MSYHLLVYIGIFLPIVIFVYMLTPKKLRWITMLVADYVFFYLISGKLFVYLLGTTVFTYFIGNLIERVASDKERSKKEITRRKKIVLASAIIINILVLFLLKYYNVWFEKKWLVPIGISYYTLMTIAYLTDVYRGVQKAEKNIAKIALYLSFFPQLMQGPITRFSQTANDLYEGKNVSYTNLKYGYQRILWGLFKKMIVADRLSAAVGFLFKIYDRINGVGSVLAMLFFTMQLYAEFSGSMDIVMGSGEIFGIKLPENFKQPFFAKNAGDFWHRWHITLGTFLKDYVFYPISLSKPVKEITKRFKKSFGRKASVFVAPTIALFFVWLCNGIWHGPQETYIFYGMYYFVLIFIENITEKSVTKWINKLKINTEGKLYKTFRFIKLFIIVNIGEMFFRSKTIADGFEMLKRAVFHSNYSPAKVAAMNLGIDKYDLLVALIGIVVIFIVDVIHEKGISIRHKLDEAKTPVRWAVIYAVIVCIIMFGAYGRGYSAVDLLYAQY